ncbi:MAG TPA: hypothetical protein VF733_06525 [Candidatus Saccharimonadales bacterium]
MFNLINKKDLQKLVLNPGFSIPVLSAVAYILAYTFEASYLSYFGVSHQFVEITVNIFVLAGGVTALCLFYLLTVLMQFEEGLMKKRRRLRRRILRLTWILLSAELLIVAYGLYTSLIWYKTVGLMLGLPLSILVVLVIELTPYLWKNRVHGFRRGLKKALRAHRSRRKKTSVSFMFCANALFAGCLIIAIGIISGRIYAHSRENFAVYKKEGKRYALIRSYSDKLILAGMDARGKLNREMYVIVIKEQASISFEPYKDADHLK